MDTISCILMSSMFNKNAYSLAPGVLLVLLDPMVFTNGDLEERIAAILTEASRHLKKVPWIISFPRKTSNGNLASCMPSGVMFSAFVKALTSLRESIARRMFLEDGGSKASRRVGSTSPSLQILTRRTKSCRDRRSISGVCCSASYGIFTYQFVMSVLGEQMKTDPILNTAGSSPSLLRISSRDKGLH
ncbi:hypothetical protein BDV29DRAFT_196301 [Aspergillus leporis]|uniref:Uncharacterized protein n=1 Tax=Aspergillus leporis TaxID=41062 RepID=A0A5N5WK77_9EURO|nr:hypothetical protein BDV29DRAFT_196301 [Aspergillus leporis]